MDFELEWTPEQDMFRAEYERLAIPSGRFRERLRHAMRPRYHRGAEDHQVCQPHVVPTRESIPPGTSRDTASLPRRLSQLYKKVTL